MKTNLNLHNPKKIKLNYSNKKVIKSIPSTPDQKEKGMDLKLKTFVFTKIATVCYGVSQKQRKTIKKMELKNIGFYNIIISYLITA